MTTQGVLSQTGCIFRCENTSFTTKMFITSLSAASLLLSTPFAPENATVVVLRKILVRIAERTSRTHLRHVRPELAREAREQRAPRRYLAIAEMARTGKLWRARSRLYRSQTLQVNMRLKALAEIYTKHSFAQLCNLNVLPTFCDFFLPNQSRS